MENVLVYQSEIRLFDQISTDDLKSLLTHLHAYQKSFQKGETIILDQDSIRQIGIVLNGRVNMIKHDVWGRENLMTWIDRFEIFGEMFAVQKENISHVSFVAARQCEVLFLPAANIIHPCPKNCAFHRALSENLFNLIGLKNRQLLDKIRIASCPTTREKIMAYLDLLADQQKSTTVVSPLSRTELAEYIHANRSSMTRELAMMKNEGLIEFQGSVYKILNI